MVGLAFQKHWLEDAIGADHDPQEIAQRIASNPHFIKVIEESIRHADVYCREGGSLSPDKTRIIAEHISRLIHGGFGGFHT